MNPRLLLNENFPSPSIKPLREAGLDVLSISETCPGMDDVDVLALAVREQRWIVTFDRDYGELVFARRHPAPPAILLLRVVSYRPEEPAGWVIQLLQNPLEYLGKLTVFNGRMNRSRLLLREFDCGND